jgi:O-antigen ligase
MTTVGLSRLLPERPLPAAHALERERTAPAVRGLQIFALALMIFPSDFVLKPVGAGGYVAALVAYFLFAWYLAATLFGLHNHLDYRTPVQISVCALWLVSLASYAVMDRTMLNGTQLNAADRWLMQLAAMSGIILVAAECLRTIEDVHKVLRALTWGAAFCGVVAALQFWLGLDITPHLKLPAFSLNSAVGAIAIGARGDVSRVAGTATDPIELGVMAGMVLPLAAYLAIHDVHLPSWRRWLPLMLIGIAIPTSVSRSAILALVLAMGVFVVLMPSAQRLIWIAGAPVAVAAVFVGAHGLIGTLARYFLAGTSDDSILHRVNNYPYVEHLVRQAPWLGTGGGTYSGQSAVNILDNQYLDVIIELGIIGLLAFVFYVVWPLLAALVARRRTADPRIRDLCAALAGAELAAIVCSATFDSEAFPIFVGVQALVVGLIGTAWRLAQQDRSPAVADHHDQQPAWR